MSDNATIDEFRDAYPDQHLNAVEEIEVFNGSVMVETEPDRTIAPRITRQLLNAGWVVSSHATRSNDGHKFWFKRLHLEEEEVTRTITETKTVGKMKRVN